MFIVLLLRWSAKSWGCSFQLRLGLEIVLNGPLFRFFLRRFILKKSTGRRNWSSIYSMKLHEVFQSKMLPHLLATFQWALLVICIAFNVNFSVSVTGAIANGGLKAVMFLHLLMLLSPVVLCVIFYRIRKGGTAERYIFNLSMITILFSIANIVLHFVNNLVLPMKATEVIAWILFNSVFSVSIYKISVVFLLPVLRESTQVREETIHKDKKIWV
ncbi:MAG: hypothetical protein PVF15_11240 [Candidatus Bathyarchaeota archaeon]|jgi:hypothetical protein